MTDSLSVLGNIVNSTSGQTIERRSARFVLQSEARRLLPNNRVIHCLRTPHGGAGGNVTVMYRPRERRAFYRGLQTCAQIWICPICAERITSHRRAIWMRVLGGSEDALIRRQSGIVPDIIPPRYRLGMITFTIAHSSGQALPDVLGRLKKCYSRFWGGRWPKSLHLALRSLGTVRGIELTYGANGWHPHIHCLVIGDLAGPVEFLEPFSEVIIDRWIDCCKRESLYANRENGIRVQNANLEVIDYINKFGMHVTLTRQDQRGITEVSKYPTKRGKIGNQTLTDLLRDSFNGDELASSHWRSGTGGMFGTRHMVASRGLLKRLQAPIDLLDDTLSAMEGYESQDDILAIIPYEAWRVILYHNLRGHVLAIADLGDRQMLADYLTEVSGVKIPELIVRYRQP